MGRHSVGVPIVAPSSVELPEPFCSCGHTESAHVLAEVRAWGDRPDAPPRHAARPCGGLIGRERCSCGGYREGRLSVVVREEIAERAARRRCRE